MGRNTFLLIVASAGLVVLLFLGIGGRSMTIAQLFDSALSVFGVRTAEEPHYDIVERIGEVEIGRYGPRLAAETIIASGDNAMNEAFFILAGYIFGGNQKRRTSP
jgi:hypothetical protein